MINQNFSHLPLYGITHPTRMNVPHFNPSQAGQFSTWFAYPGRLEGWVDVDGWLYIKMV